MRKKFLRARGETGHITFTVLRGTRVSSYVAPENRQSREHRRRNGLPLSLYLSISVYLPIYLSTQRLRRTKDRFSGSAVEDRSKFFFQWRASSEGDYVEKNVSSRNKEETS